MLDPMASAGDSDAEGSPSGVLDDPLDEDGFPDPPDHSRGFDGDESFAAEFYRAGSDWSCLVEKAGVGGSGGGKFVQKDLFQMWGIVKAVPGPVGGSLKRRRGEGDSRGREKGKVEGWGSAGGRGCPFYKRIAGTPFTVDAFRYGCIDGCLAYFLSHFHSDHYGGLSKKWCHGPIYCTPLTARLVALCLSVNPQYICPLELDRDYAIEGITVRLLDANHCPGAALIYFRLADGRCYLHTGDFRASKSMQSSALLIERPINLLYLDTTYCNPKYRFPSQEDVVNFAIRLSKSCLKKQPRTLIIVGAYSIGKEHVYVALSQALGVKIYANSSRRRILESFGWPELSGKLCSNGSDAPLHVLPMSHIRHERLKQHMETFSHRFSSVLAFRPTGWTYSEATGNQLDTIRPNSKGNITIYGVPYSEHSNFTELKDFVQFLKPGKIIPTVNNGNKAHREKMQSFFQEWLKE